MKIFLVEDDTLLNEAIATTFSSIGYQVTTFSDGKVAFENINKSYDLFMIDINLPHVNGIELVKQIKKIDKDANIFIMSADLDIKTIVKAYDIGCADYIKKPFDIREIIAKIKHTLKLPIGIVKFKNCLDSAYNTEKKVFIHKGQEIRLTAKELRLLEMLIKNANNTVSNEQIEDHVWGETFKNGHVRQLVAKLRKKISCNIIENHNSTGYIISTVN
jgi:DNA-binding response OmpR family regulator